MFEKNCLNILKQTEWKRQKCQMELLLPNQSNFILLSIIMAQQQHAADVHPDELYPPNKRYDLIDANKKIDLEHFWYTLKEGRSNYRLTFMLEKKELSLTLDDVRTIFHLPQANDNNHDRFVPPPSFSDMVPLYRIELGFIMELKTSSSFKITGLLQPWKTLCKIFSKFTKIIIGHYMTHFLEILKRARDRYHNLKDYDIMKNIFNSGRYKDKVGMKILEWMITEEMKHTEHYRMYTKVFGIDVPLNLSQPTESTQGMHRTPSAPRSPNPKLDAGESSAPKQSTMIRFRIPQWRSTCLNPPALVPTIEKADDMVLQDTLQVSLAEHKSQQEQEARENVELVQKHLASKEIKKMVDGLENVDDNSTTPRNDEHHIPSTRLEPKSDMESPEEKNTDVVIPENVNKEEEEEEITNEVYELERREKGKNVKESRSTSFPTPIRSPRIHTDLVSSDTEKLQELTVTESTTTPSSPSPSNKFVPKKSFDTLADHLQEVMHEVLPIMVDKHIKEQVEKQVPKQVRTQVLVYVAEGLIMERQKNKDEMDKMIAKAILQELDTSVRNYMSGHIFHVHPVQQQTTSAQELQYQLIPVVCPRDQDDPHDDAHPEGENSAKRQKTSKHVFGELSSEQANEKE
ncbi:hypothetical protein Tco_0013539 [Tanacetum coccineum]